MSLIRRARLCSTQKWTKFDLNKIELEYKAFVWIIGPKPYIPEKGSKGEQYVFVFDCQDD